MKEVQITREWSEFYRDELKIRTFLKRILCNIELLFLIIKYRPRSVIEVGTGTGALSAFISWFIPKVIAIDNDKKVLLQAKRNGKTYGRKIDFIAADAFKLPFKPNCIDISFSQGFYEHFRDQDAEILVQEQTRICKQVVLINIPSDHYPAKPFGNERLLSPSEWKGIFLTAIQPQRFFIRSRYCRIDVEAFKHALFKFRWHGFFEELVTIRKR